MQSRFFDKILRSLEYKHMKQNDGLILNNLGLIIQKLKQLKRKEKEKYGKN